MNDKLFTVLLWIAAPIVAAILALGLALVLYWIKKWVMNPQIEPVLNEISTLLKKHNMAGLVIVGNQTHCDWRMEIDPTWSCAFWEDKEKGLLRIKAKSEDFISKAAQKQCLEQTVGTFVTFQDTMAKLNEQLDTLLLMISKHVTFIGKSTEQP